MDTVAQRLGSYAKLLVAAFVGFMVVLVLPLAAYADYSAPSWWGGNQCDSVNYNKASGLTPVLFTTWSGVQACGYGPLQNASWPDVAVTMPGASAPDYEWECTELVKRYLYIAYGATAQSSTFGKDVVTNYAGAFPGKFTAVSNTNGNPNHKWPAVGDVLSYNVGTFGHTAIITGVTITDQTNGNATLTLAEQNASTAGTTTQQFVGWKIKGSVDDPNDTGSDTVTGWLHPTINPAGSWTAAGTFTPAQANATATLLSSGKVLMAGGAQSCSYSQANIYNPSTKTWSSTNSMSTARNWHTANLVTISGGGSRVLVAGGYTSCGAGARNTAELYNESSGTWSAAASMANSRYTHTATTLNDGTVLVTGGADASGVSQTSVEEYDPVADSWSSKASLSVARKQHRATLLSDGRVLVTGGINASGTTVATTEIYDPSTNTWSNAASMSYARANHAAILLPNGNVLVIGSGSGTTQSTAEVYNPTTNSWSSTPNLSYARSGATPPALITLGDGTTKRVLTTAGAATSNAELYDYVGNTWSVTGAMSTIRSGGELSPLSDGTVLVAGGYDPVSGNYRTTSDFYTPPSQ